ncbi:MAG: HD domain-containing protein [Chloroflexi bacterium]|nr:HD domain-containing protein [Chloroflexota bacterium]
MIKPFHRQQQVGVLTKLRDFLTQENVDSYLVGGYIRDTLLNRPTRDIDVVVAAPAPEVARKLAAWSDGKYVLLDEEREIARVVLIEDEQDPKARFNVDFSTLRGDIGEDLSCRDFTVNAIAVDFRQPDAISARRFIDPFQGQGDLAKGLLRAVSENAFVDDPARLLRAVRLAAEYGFTIEGHTQALICSHSQLICQVAGERVREELCRLLSVSDAARYVYYLDELGLLTAIIPELALTKGVEQPVEHFWDVFRHSIETVAAFELLLRSRHTGQEDVMMSLVPCIPDMLAHFEEEVSGGVRRAVLVKIAALLHDIAKPQTKSIDPDGRARFLGHTKEGAVMAGDILQRLRFSTRETKIVQNMVQSHLRLWQMGSDSRPTHRAIYRFFRDTGDTSIDVIILTLADFLAARGPNVEPEEWQRHCQMMQYVWSEHEKEAERVVPSRLIDGHDLISVFALEPGPALGRLLEAVREAQGIGEIATREEALGFVRKQIDRERDE